MIRRGTHRTRPGTHVAMAVVLIAASAGGAEGQHRVTERDVERVLPVMAHPLGQPAGFYSAGARGAQGFMDYFALNEERAKPGFDPHAYIVRNAPAAVAPPGSRYLLACSQEQPIAGAKVPGGMNSDVFSPLAVHALTGGAGATEAARSFYAARGFVPVGQQGNGTTRLIAPDRSVLVTVAAANPLVMDPIARSACSDWRGPVVTVALYSPSWSESDRGWTRQKYDAFLAEHGLEHREYQAIVGALRATRLMVQQAEWREFGEAERDLVAPNWRIYVKHRQRLDPLLDRFDNPELDVR